MKSPPSSLICVSPQYRDDVYPPDLTARIAELTNLLYAPLGPEELIKPCETLGRCQVLFAGWGMPALDQDLLDKMPQLELVLYAAGSTEHLITPASRDRGLRVCATPDINAIPVVEYTVAQVLFGLKLGWQHVRTTRQTRRWERLEGIPGAFGGTVGLISLGAIGRRVADALRSFGVKILAYDPHAAPADAEALGLTLVGLDEVFRGSHVVSVHTPLRIETRGMIQESHIRCLPQQATLINTSRGGVIDQPGLVRTLANRPDLTAVLDVLDPEPPPRDDPIWDLDNVILTPHIAGSMGAECKRMGEAMIDEYIRFMQEEDLWYEAK
ncbi:MAG: hydroxyacid dehydrogenase [Planctomycetota bacterium]